MKVFKVCFSAIIVLIFSSVLMTGCSGGGGSAATAPTASIVPTGVTATPGNGNATIAWKAVPDATSYNIYWSTAAGVTPANGTKMSSATSSHLLTGLTNGTTYYFVVTAIVGTSESAASTQVSAMPIAAPPPAAPTGVSTTPGNGQVTIAWTPVAGATSYNIYWSTITGVTPDTGTKIAGVVAPPSVVTGLTNGTTYYFVVTAVNANGESVASAPEVSTMPTAAVPPAAPTGVTATPGNGQVTISWTAVSGATSYNLYWALAPGVTPLSIGVTKITGATSPYILTGLTNGTVYYFVVTAVNANGESPLSAEVSALPSATPGAAPFIQATILSLPGLGNPLFWLQHVDVYTDSTVATPITNATVIVNGNPLFYDTARGTYNTNTTYQTVANGFIPPGATVTVSVTIGGTTYTATGTEFTTFPILNTPPMVLFQGQLQPILFVYVDNTWTWTAGAPTAGATYLFGILDSGSIDLPPHQPNVIVYPTPVNTGLVSIPTSSTSGMVPANALIPGEYEPILGMATAGVGKGIGHNTGTPLSSFSPNAAAGSGLWVGEITVYTSIPIILDKLP